MIKGKLEKKGKKLEAKKGAITLTIASMD